VEREGGRGVVETRPVGGAVLGDAGSVRVKAGNVALGALHAERAARQQAQAVDGGERANATAGGEAQGGGGGASAQAQAKAGGKAKAAGKQKRPGEGLGEELDDFALLEQAIEANARMTDVQNPLSDAAKARVYGWGRNPNRKDLAEKLSAKIGQSQDKRKPAEKGGDGGRGGRGGRGRK
jgi:hypothetical protein